MAQYDPNDTRMVTLTMQTIQGDAKPEPIKLSRNAAIGSALFKDMIADDEGAMVEIPLSDGIRGIKSLQICAEFLEQHKADPMKEIEKPIKSDKMRDLVGVWDADLADGWDQETLFAVILTTSFLDIPTLLDLAITKFCTLIKDKDADQVKDILGIAKDITPEEEKEVRRKSDWIYNVKPAQPAPGAASSSGGQ